MGLWVRVEEGLGVLEGVALRVRVGVGVPEALMPSALYRAACAAAIRPTAWPALTRLPSLATSAGATACGRAVLSSMATALLFTPSPSSSCSASSRAALSGWEVMSTAPLLLLLPGGGGEASGGR